MPYIPTTWNPGGPPGISAARLNKIEQGIADATATADAALPKAGGTMTGDLTVAKPVPRIFLKRTDTSNPHAGFNALETDGTKQANELLYDYNLDAWVIWDGSAWPLITAKNGQKINGVLSLGNPTGEKLHVYENGNTKAGFGFNMSSTNELVIFHSSPTGSQGRITFGKRLDDGTFQKTATMFSDGKLLVSEGTYGTSARLQVGNSNYGLGSESSRLYLVSEFGEVWTADAVGNPLGRVWDSSLLRNNNGLLELLHGGAWIPVGGSFLPYSERRGAGGQPAINQASTWVTLVNLNMRGRLERVNFGTLETGEGSGYSFTATFRVTVDGKVVWQVTAQAGETSSQDHFYLGGFNTDEQADYLYFNSNFKIEVQVSNIPSAGANVRYEVFYRQAI
jgi:hypothetical protein